MEAGVKVGSHCRTVVLVMVPQGQTIGSFDFRSFFSFFTNQIPGSSCITWLEKINDLSTVS